MLQGFVGIRVGGASRICRYKSGWCFKDLKVIRSTHTLKQVVVKSVAFYSYPYTGCRWQ